MNKKISFEGATEEKGKKRLSINQENRVNINR